MTDAIQYEITGSRSNTDHLDPEDWSVEDGLLRLEKEDEILFVPFDRLSWIRRKKDED